MKDEVNREWISVAEMQQILGIGRSKAYELLATGEIPAVKVGRMLRVERAALETWLEANRYRPALDSKMNEAA